MQHEGRVCGSGLPKTLPTDVASPCVHCFREAGSCVSVRISRVRAYVFLVYAHDTPPRVQHFSAFHYFSGH